MKLSSPLTRKSEECNSHMIPGNHLKETLGYGLRRRYNGFRSRRRLCGMLAHGQYVLSAWWV